MGGGLEARGEGPRGDEPYAGSEVVLEGELDSVRLGGSRRLGRVGGSAAGGGDQRRRERLGRGGGCPDALELVVVVEEQLVGLEGGGEGEGEEEEEGEEQEERAARRCHGSAAVEEDASTSGEIRCSGAGRCDV